MSEQSYSTTEQPTWRWNSHPVPVFHFLCCFSHTCSLTTVAYCTWTRVRYTQSVWVPNLERGLESLTSGRHQNRKREWEVHWTNALSLEAWLSPGPVPSVLSFLPVTLAALSWRSINLACGGQVQETRLCEMMLWLLYSHTLLHLKLFYRVQTLALCLEDKWLRGTPLRAV